VNLSPFFAGYLAAWIVFCAVAVGIAIRDRGLLIPEWRKYVRFLTIPWKLWLFVPALIFVTYAGRYTNDETWDVVTGAGMAVLTFLTAPWSIGLLYQVCIRRRPIRYLMVALALLLFSSSWFYDAYLLLRDGAYTRRWVGNLLLSPLIYIAAGFLWNLEAKSSATLEGTGWRLSFVRDDWPSPPPDRRFGPILYVSIPFILIAAFVLVEFVGWKVGLLR
jgi:hypothetical protein